MLDWPNADPLTESDPIEIERFLRTTIRESHVSLLGEIDLNSPTNYAGINWSLLELADYVIGSGAANDYVASFPSAKKFPASVCIWSVGHAQGSEEGGRLWDQLESLPPPLKSKFAQKFTEAMSVMHFDLFEDELHDAQHHVQLAFIHSVLPDFAIKRFGEIVELGVRHDRPPHVIFVEIMSDPGISRAVVRLFSPRQELALDLIQRTFNYIAYGYELDLPPRITSKLSSNQRGVRRESIRESYPVVQFQEEMGRPFARGTTGWRLVNSAHAHQEADGFGTEIIFAEKGSSERIQIIDPSSGFLVFDDNGKLLHGDRLPANAGYILWHKSVEFVSDLPENDSIDLWGTGWGDWKYSYFAELNWLEVRNWKGKIFKLSRLAFLKVEEFPIQNLVNTEGLPVFDDFPRLATGEGARVTNHLENTQKIISNGEPLMPGFKYGYIDLTATTGLGKSTKVIGLVIPGLKITGLGNSLVAGESRTLQMYLPEGWSYVAPSLKSGQTQAAIHVTGDPENSTQKIQVQAPDGVVYPLSLETPLLSWSLTYFEKESQTMATSTIFTLEDRFKVNALILHGVNDYIPPILVGKVKVFGKKRGADARYDLRFLREALEDQGTQISTKWNYRDLMLAEFVSNRNWPRVTTGSRRRQIVLTSFSDFENLELWRESEIFSEEQWVTYLQDKVAEHDLYRGMLRNGRGR